MQLADIWAELKRRLAKNSEIRSWSSATGFLGDTFTVVGPRSGHVVIKSPYDLNPQNIPDQDFISVLEVWNDYVDGKLTRADIQARTKFSKFIISILHSLEAPQRPQ
jgi:hypothetical protein